MSYETTSTLSAILKTMYPKDISTMVYDGHPFLEVLKKNTNFRGENMVVPVSIGGPASRSSLASVAFANWGTQTSYKFVITRAKDYVGMAIEREALMAGKGDGGIKDVLRHTIDLGMMKITNSLASAVFRSGSGSVGKISAGSNVGTPTITLSNPEDIVNYEKGDKIQLSSADGTGALRNAGATATITALDRDAGTLTFGGNLTAEIAAAAASDYIFLQGDHAVKVKGLAGWLPSTAPAAGDSFFGLDRSVDPVRLAGCRVDGSGFATMEEALVRGISRVAREGGAPDYIVVNNKHWQDLAVELNDKVQYSQSKEGSVGFQFLVVNGVTGPCKVIADRFCEVSKAYVLTSKTWELASLGNAPSLFDETKGGEANIVTAADAYEVRGGYYGNLVCRYPAYNGVVFGF